MDLRDYPVHVSAIQRLSRDSLLFQLSPLGDDLLLSFAPGAHVDVTLPNGLIRQYSLCNAPADRSGYLIAVKKNKVGRGGSRYMHDELKVGAQLSVGAPRNHFPLVETAPHSILIAGGIGITPIVAMAERLSMLGKSGDLHYCVRKREDAIFLERMDDATLHVSGDSSLGCRIDFQAIVRAAPAGTHFYCCGPASMLDAFVTATAGLPPIQVHLERFGGTAEVATSGGFAVELARTGMTVEVKQGQTILDAIRACGVSVRASCQQGICGACETTVIAGIPDHRDTLLSPDEKASGDVMMICCSGSRTPRLVLDI